MTITFQQTDTNAAVSYGTGAICSGSANITTSTADQASSTGTPGVGTQSGSFAKNVTNGAWAVYEIHVDSSATWASGTWTVNIDVTTSNKNLTLNGGWLCRVNSSGVNQATIGSNTAAGISLSSTGSKQFTISGSAQTPGAGDMAVLMLAVSNGANSAQSFTITNDNTIVSPFSVPSVVTVSSSATVTGVSKALASAPATINAISSVSGVGIAQLTGTATINAAASVSGTGITERIGTGTINAAATVSGSSQSNAISIVSATSASSLSAVGSSNAITTVSATSASSVSGTAAAQGTGTATITAQSTVSGVGDSTMAGGASVSTINAVAVVSGIGAADVLEPVVISAGATVAGVGMSIVAQTEQPSIGGGRWPWVWDAIDEELLRRKSREEQRRIRIQLGIIPPETKEEEELASEELVKPDIVPPIFKRSLLDEKEFIDRVMRRVREEQSRIRIERFEERHKEHIERLWQEAANEEFEIAVTHYKKRKAKRLDEDVLLLLS